MSANEIELTFIRCPSCKSLMPSSAVKCGMCGFELDSGKDKNVGDSSSENRKTRLRQRTGSGSVDDLINQSEESESSEHDEENASNREQTVESPRPIFAPVDEFRPGRTGTALHVRPDSSDNESDSKRPERKVEDEKSSTPPTTFRPSKTTEELSNESHEDSDEDEEESSNASPYRERNDQRKDSDSRELRREHGQKFNSDDESTNDDDADDSDDQPKKKRRRRKKKRRVLEEPTDSDGQSSSQAEKPETSQNKKDHESSHIVRSRPYEGTRFERSDTESVDRKLGSRPREDNKDQAANDERQSELSRSTLLSKSEPKERASFSAHVGERKMSQSNGESVLIGWFVNYSTKRTGIPFEIRLGKQFIGRQELRGDDLIIQDSAVSTPHCLLQVDDAQTVLIQDLMSENGTFVKKRGDSEYHQLETSIKLEHGDRLKLGSYELIVCLVP